MIPAVFTLPLTPSAMLELMFFTRVRAHRTKILQCPARHRKPL